ncbi:oligomeric golgi complex component, COG2-domain-containing protein [Elsinoe ampelina]|uniref:Conserved oligomeric Golgi complex subunit 2 n=1 Tax=Elsinoe ampelina TaxID=302913 RepID=A0A6A6G4V5_9PEZI|nr:oligomeric golgi complex component, COG2-domain-containing protein [Elsinoe ampelina]
MSKFYLPSSTPASTTSPSPLHSPSVTTPTALRHLPSTSSPPQSYPSTPPIDSDAYSDDDLPYPTPLPRSAFLDPAFTPEKYLSSLRNRHQTLEDLRTELRDRVRELGKELVDLVNGEYEDLMGVGMQLTGGEEKVEGVRVGVLGFGREVEGLRAVVKGRKEEVGRLVGERRRVRGEVVLGRRLLEVGERVEELERRLGLKAGGEGEGQEEDEEDEDEEEDGLGKLKGNVRLYAQLMDLMERVGHHPFLDAQAARVKSVRDALLLDLGAALRLARRDANGQNTTLKVIGMYRDVGEAAEAVRILKGK